MNIAKDKFPAQFAADVPADQARLMAATQRPIIEAMARRAGFARAPEGVGVPDFIGAACLCGIGDTVALLLADQAFTPGPESAVAKIGVLIGSTLAAVLGAAVLVLGSRRHPVTEGPSSPNFGATA
jgi:hypothetical protein